MIWNGSWPTHSETVAWTHLSSNKKALKTEEDKRLRASHPKFNWQFLILSLCATGWRIRLDWSVWSRLWWPAYLPALWFATASTPARGGAIWGGWGSCAVGPLRINSLGGLFHTMPLHVCLPYQECDLVSCPKGSGGKGGNVLHLLKQPPSTLPENHPSHSMGCSQPPATEWEIKPCAAQTSSVWPLKAFFNLCYNSAAWWNSGLNKNRLKDRHTTLLYEINKIKCVQETYS